MIFGKFISNCNRRGPVRPAYDIQGDAETRAGGPMRYVSWLGHWFGQLIPASGPHIRRESRSGRMVPGGAAQLSNEDLFYIAMLGPHV
jgi:hypothetical protein